MLIEKYISQALPPLSDHRRLVKAPKTLIYLLNFSCQIEASDHETNAFSDI
jgi:hypothetical protein